MPQVGNQSFSLTCGNAPPTAQGALLLAGSALATPMPFLGVQLWVGPGGYGFVAVPAGSNAMGAAELLLPLPGNAALGARVHAQFVWLGPTSPAPCPPAGLSASNALEITIQP